MTVYGKITEIAVVGRNLNDEKQVLRLHGYGMAVRNEVTKIIRVYLATQEILAIDIKV